jgi:hypothetical protein
MDEAEWGTDDRPPKPQKRLVSACLGGQSGYHFGLSQGSRFMRATRMLKRNLPHPLKTTKPLKLRLEVLKKYET